MMRWDRNLLGSQPLHYSFYNYTIIQSITQLSMDRRLWTPEVLQINIQEDQHIIRLVAKFGTKKWPIISERLCSET